VKTYPYAYWLDEEGTIWVNPKLPGHSVNYQGVFKLSNNQWEGQWEILNNEIRKGQFQEDGEILVTSGNWKMNQVQ